MDSEYRNPKNEILPREQLRALQFVKLRRLCNWAWEKSDFHRRLWTKGTLIRTSFTRSMISGAFLS